MFAPPPRFSASIPKARAQSGVSLLTIALLLFMMSAALAAGVVWLRAGLPGQEIASAQRLALARANEAILGFASTHHRLPCPADTPGGEENCTRAKGYLPVTALGLDTMLHTSGTRTMRYMVYRKSGGDLAENSSVRVADASSRQLPKDKYDPTPRDDDKNPLTDVFDARNGLDMCKILLSAYGDEGRKTGEASYAHYKKGGAPVNVAYGLALPGAGSRDNDDPFDGVNADDTKTEMEAPDKSHDATYDDFVFMRDFPSLMSVFGCQPVDYRVTRNYTETTASGDDFNSAVGNVIGSFLGEAAPGEYADKERVRVEYDESGTVTPMLASVESVKMATSMIKSANEKFESTKESIRKTRILSIIQSAYDTVGMALSIIKTVDSSIKLGKAIGVLSASLGLYMPGYVAIALYGVSMGTQIAATAITVAGTALTITATAQISAVYSRFGDDEALMGSVCGIVEKGNETLSETGKAQEDEKKNAEKAMEDAKKDMDAAYAALDGALGTISACYQTDTTAKASYAPFADAEKRDVLFGAQIDLENEVAKFTEEIKGQEDTMNERDTTRQEVQAQIEEDVKDFEEGMKNAGETPPPHDTYMASVYTQYKVEYDAAAAKKAELEKKKQESQVKLDEAKAALDAAIGALPAGDVPPLIDNETANFYQMIGFPLPVWTQCNYAYQYLHGAYWETAYRETAVPLYPSSLGRVACIAANNKRGESFCDDYYNVSQWRQYHDKKGIYEAAKQRFDSLKDSPPELAAPGSCGGGGVSEGKLGIWSHEDAMKILLRVDKRGALQ
jgi:hypothetical protein